MNLKNSFSREMLSTYQPADVEKKWYSAWLEHEVFRGAAGPSRKTFSMVIPPPNITGNLHMGHALNNTVQDVLVRWRRMQGYSTCWFPGTDHAGIATQVVVERELREKEKKSRYDLGREEFVKRVWEWKEKYGSVIDDQLKKLGVSCDWSRYSFTMDPKRSKAVREAFVRLHKKNLIYRDEYIVNWCPRCQTALSDLEVEHPENEAPGILYYLRYPLEKSVEGISSITIATVRPETILADVAVAVYPEDPRYKQLIGKTAILPLVGRKLKIIADEWADPDVGSGAVKITPAHDPNDFEVGRRHDLPRIRVIDFYGKMSLLEFLQTLPSSAPEKQFLQKYQGLDRFACREEIVKDLKAGDYLEKEEPWPVHAGRCARSGDIIEPSLSVQWFLSMKTLVDPAIRVVEEKKIQFHPEWFKILYLEWMKNIREWCISRQLWWGHQIPAWYCVACDAKNISGLASAESVLISRGAKPIVGLEKPATCPQCKSHELLQDPDVLDTWFSSALWPLSVMGWPEETEDLRHFYPTSVLSTSSDILYLWVSRMIMMGLEFRDEIPFSHVSIHATILDREGRRMSKSKGTGVDPLDLIRKHGADAVRFGMLLIAQNQYAKFNEEKIIEARNFANKIWNASRFVLLNLPENFTETFGKKSVEPETFSDQWILSRLSRVAQSVTDALESYEFSRAASALYDFFWGDFCDWYLELSKLSLQGEEAPAKLAVQGILWEVLRTSLILLHPFLPFLTEEVWHQVNPSHDFLVKAAWPEPRYEAPEERFTLEGPYGHVSEEPFMDCLMEAVRAARDLRAAVGVKPKESCPILIQSSHISLYRQMEKEIRFLTQSSEVTFSENLSEPPKKALSARLTSGSLYLLWEGVVDLKSELGRLEAEQEKVSKELGSVKHRLQDSNFVQKARQEILEGARNKEKLLQEKLDKIKERITSLRAE